MPEQKLSETARALKAPLGNGRLHLDVEDVGHQSSLSPPPRPSGLSAEQLARVLARGCANGTEQGINEDIGAHGAMGATGVFEFIGPISPVSSRPFDTDKLTLNDAVLLAVGACCFTISEVQVCLF